MNHIKILHELFGESKLDILGKNLFVCGICDSFFSYRFYFNCSTKFQNKGDKVKDLYQSIIYKANCFIYVKGKHLREYFQSVFSEPILHST